MCVCVCVCMCMCARHRVQGNSTEVGIKGINLSVWKVQDAGSRVEEEKKKKKKKS